MYYILFKHLAEEGLTPRLVIDGFENMVTDKMIILGVRRFMPGTSIYGFYHNVPPPNVLCFFIDKNESRFAPLPDRIICNGKRFMNILIREHFPKEKLALGAALRYFYLYDIKSTSRHMDDNKVHILLTLPLERGAALELFYKVKKSAKDIEDCSLFIKPHPMDIHIIDELKKDFVGNMNIIEGGMAEAIGLADIVVSAATGAALDCLIAGKEVIRIGRDTNIDLDPLAWFEEFDKAVYGVDQLKEKIMTLSMKIKNRLYKNPSYHFLLPELFLPQSEENMKAFLPVK